MAENVNINDSADKENQLIDLYSDYSNFYTRWLHSEGIKLKHPDDGFLDYLIYSTRRIIPHKRNIVKSKYFVCPEGFTHELSYIEDKIRNGHDLTPFLSRGIQDCRRDDMMLYDWGIYHLHISTEINPDTGFVMRSSQLLFVIFTCDTAYFIKAVPHQGLPNMWSMKECLEEVYEQWPYLLEPYKVNGIVEPILSDEGIAKLRSMHMNPIITLKDGSCICSPVKGFTCDGTPISALMFRDKIRRMFEAANCYLSENLNSLIRQLNLPSDKKAIISLKGIDVNSNSIVVNIEKALVALDINDYTSYGKFTSRVIL